MAPRKTRPPPKTWISGFLKSYGLVTCVAILVALIIAVAVAIRLVLNTGELVEFDLHSDLVIPNFFTWKMECKGKPKGI